MPYKYDPSCCFVKVLNLKFQTFFYPVDFINFHNKMKLQRINWNLSQVNISYYSSYLHNKVNKIS